jgi:hypothetical protein
VEVEQNMHRHSCHATGVSGPCGTPRPPIWKFRFYGSSPNEDCVSFQQLWCHSDKPGAIQDAVLNRYQPVSPRLSRLLQDKCKEFWL